MYFSFYEYVRGHGGGRQSAYLDDATVILILFTKAFLFTANFFFHDCLICIVSERRGYLAYLKEISLLASSSAAVISQQMGNFGT